MRNLFIMHTQYNLVIACGLVKSKKFGENNDLILNSEFKLKSHHKMILESIFSNVWYSQEEFYNKKNIYSELNLYNKLYKSRKYIKDQEYDNIFISQEQYFDTMILSKLSKNKKFKLYNIEEDIYFSYENSYNNLEKEEFLNNESTIKRKIQSSLRRILFGENIYFEPHFFYGMNSNYDEYYCLFPNAIRKHILDRKFKEVTLDIICDGVRTLYPDNNLILEDKKYIVIFFDLIERYENLQIIEDIIEEVVCIAKNKNLKIIYKYHPREIDNIRAIQEYKDALQIESNIPSETILMQLFNKDVTIIGNASSALLMSAKMGYKTMSTAPICNRENSSIMEAYDKIGIKLISNLNDIEI